MLGKSAYFPRTRYFYFNIICCSMHLGNFQKNKICVVSLPPSDKNGLYVWLQYSNTQCKKSMPLSHKNLLWYGTHNLYIFVWLNSQHLLQKFLQREFFIHKCKIGIICWLPELKIMVLDFTSPPPNHCRGPDLSPIKSF